MLTDSHRQITPVSCTCVYSKSGKCKHVAALIYFINNEESLTKTDAEQEWGKPTVRQLTQEKYSKGSYFSEMFNRIKDKSNVIDNNKSNVIKHKLDLSGLKQPSAIQIILNESAKNADERAVQNLMTFMLNKVVENLEKDKRKSCVEKLVQLCEHYPVYTDIQTITVQSKDFYDNCVMMPVDKIVDLCCDTVNQSSCVQCFEARRIRISASTNAHKIKSRIRKTVESLITELLYPKKIATASTKYGCDNEANTRREYEMLFNVNVITVGVLISRYQPWLRASLDGVVIENESICRIVEIKCPFTCKKQSVIDYQSEKCNVNFLHFQNKKVQLRSTCMYYTQCQIQMYVAGVNKCDLFVFSPVENGSTCIQVMRDENFLKSNISKCENFYFQEYLSVVYGTVTKDETRNSNVKKNCNQMHGFTGKDINSTI